MIISASRRTDIPTYYSEWFFRRLREGFVLVRNPMNHRQVSRIRLTPDAVDAIVFWTKNPAPMLPKLGELHDYMYYFQFTITPYGHDLEPGLPSKKDCILPAFFRLSESIGPERVIWRYDPILLTQTYTPDFHLRAFEALACRLSSHTKTCVISFLDFYRNTKKNLSGSGPLPFSGELPETLVRGFAEIAGNYGIVLKTCAEEIDLQKYGIEHGACIDQALLESLLGCPLNAGKDKNQRPACGCMESIDIGAYNTCKNGCRYCYAVLSETSAAGNLGRHDPCSPLLTGHLEAEDRVTERNMRSLKETQLKLPF